MEAALDGGAPGAAGGDDVGSIAVAAWGRRGIRGPEARSVSSVSDDGGLRFELLGGLAGSGGTLDHPAPPTSATDVVALKAQDLSRLVRASASVCRPRILCVRQSAGLSSERGQIPRRWMVRTGSCQRHAAGSTA